MKFKSTEVERRQFPKYIDLRLERTIHKIIIIYGDNRLLYHNDKKARLYADSF